jgi:hypothetical protein
MNRGSAAAAAAAAAPADPRAFGNLGSPPAATEGAPSICARELSAEVTEVSWVSWLMPSMSILSSAAVVRVGLTAGMAVVAWGGGVKKPDVW